MSTELCFYFTLRQFSVQTATLYLCKWCLWKTRLNCVLWLTVNHVCQFI